MEHSPQPLSINSRSARVIFNFTLDLSVQVVNVLSPCAYFAKAAFFSELNIWTDGGSFEWSCTWFRVSKTTGPPLFFFFYNMFLAFANTFRSIVCFTQITHCSISMLSASFSRDNSCKFRLVTCSHTQARYSVHECVHNSWMRPETWYPPVRGSPWTCSHFAATVG